MATKNSEIVAKIRASRAQFRTDLAAVNNDLKAWKQRAEKDATVRPRVGPMSGGGSMMGGGGGGGGGGMFGSAWRTGAVAATVAVGAMAVATAKVDMNMEAVVARLAGVSDGTETVTKQLAELVKLSEQPAVNFEMAAKASAALQAGGMMSPAETRRTIGIMANAGALAGATAEDMDRIMTNVKQLLSGSGELTDVKEIAAVIPIFRTLSDSLSGGKYDATFLKKALTELEKLPQAAQTAQSKMDKLKSEAQQFLFSQTKGRVAGAMGSLADTGRNLLKGDFTGAGTSFVEAGDFLNPSKDMPSAADRFEPEKKEIERRKQALFDLKEQEKTQQQAREDAMRKEFRDRNEILSLEVEMARAAEAHDKEALATLEDKRDVLENAAKLAKQYNVSEEAAAEAIKSANNARRMTQEDEQARQAKKTLADAQAETNIRELRNRGRNGAADRAEADRTETARVQQLRDQNVPEEAAREQAARERSAAKGGGRIRGAKYKTGTGKSGLDALKDLNNRDGGGSALDRNAAEMEAAANKRKDYADGTMADMFKPVIGFDGATSGAKKTATVEDKLSAPGVSSDKTMETAMKAALQSTNALLEKIVPLTSKKSEPQKR